MEVLGCDVIFAIGLIGHCLAEISGEDVAEVLGYVLELGREHLVVYFWRWGAGFVMLFSWACGILSGGTGCVLWL